MLCRRSSVCLPIQRTNEWPTWGSPRTLSLYRSRGIHACFTPRLRNCPLEDCWRRARNPLAQHRRGPQHGRLVARRACPAARQRPPVTDQTKHQVCRCGAGAEEDPAHQLIRLDARSSAVAPALKSRSGWRLSHGLEGPCFHRRVSAASSAVFIAWARRRRDRTPALRQERKRPTMFP
jgi:hypothetical protein